MAFNRAQRYFSTPPKKLSKEQQFEKLWTEFEEFYLQIIIDNVKVVREAKKKYKNLLCAPQIQTNLDKMNQMLKEEDQQNRQMKTIGDCLEYVLRNKIIEVLCAYAMIDKPRGFFKLAIGVLSEMFGNIHSTSILSHSSVHPGVNQLLRCIYRNIKSWKFNENGTPDMSSIQDQEPYILDCTYEIFELLNSIAKKVSDEPYLVKVFFSGQMDITNGESAERICLPFQILVQYFKIQNKLLSTTERDVLRSILLKCLNCMSKDQTFSDYISNESDFIDIFMQILASQIENLPNPLLHIQDHGFDIQEQLKTHYNEMIVDQFKGFIDACFFLKEILSKVFNEHNHHGQTGLTGSQILTNSNASIGQGFDSFQDQKHEIQVKESFQISFFQLILCNIVQPYFLEKDQIQRARTLLQYLIEILVVLNDKSIARLIFAFFFNKMDCLRRQYENVNALQNNQMDERSMSDNITDQLNYYQNDQLSHFDDENMIDYENNNKKKDQQKDSKPISNKQQSFDLSILAKSAGEKMDGAQSSNSGQTNQSPRRVKQKSIYTKLEQINDNECLSQRTISNQGLLGQKQSQNQLNDPMTLLRLQRIDNLLKEAEDVQDIKSDIENHNHFNQKLNKYLNHYDGEKMLLNSLQNMFRMQEGVNIVMLQMVHTILRIEGIKQFFRDFLVDDIKITVQENLPATLIQENVGRCLERFEEEDFEKVTSIVDELAVNEMANLCKINEYVVECNNDVIISLLKHLETFFSNSPDENILIIDIILLLIDDSESMLSDSDTLYFLVYLLQNYQDSFIQRLEILKLQAQGYENDENIIYHKIKLLYHSMESDEEELQISPRFRKRDPNALIAENLIIFDGLYKQFQRFVIHHYLGFQMITQYSKTQSEDYSQMTKHYAQAMHVLQDV